jgi:hypothetical protein
MPEKKPDPTKDPEFQKVVQTFLHTKPQPHKPIGKRKIRSKRKRKNEQSASST